MKIYRHKDGDEIFFSMEEDAGCDFAEMDFHLDEDGDVTIRVRDSEMERGYVTFRPTPDDLEMLKVMVDSLYREAFRRKLEARYGKKGSS